MSFVILVRHADIDLPPEAGDIDPDLSEAGHVRSQALAAWLAEAGVRRIYASGARRTFQTLVPLAARLGLVPRVIPQTGDLVADLGSHAGDGPACVAGHSDTVPEIIAALGADASGIRIERSDFSSLFVVSNAGSPSARVLRLSYGGVPP